MNRIRPLLLIVLLGLLPCNALAQSLPAAMDAPATQETSNVVHHTIQVHGRPLHYTATAGLMPIPDEQGRPQAEIFYVAYMREDEPSADRPITFAFNGGPGAASIWLHLAALGPRRAVFADEGKALPDRYRLVDNEYTWLEFTDLVFIDPPAPASAASLPASRPNSSTASRPTSRSSASSSASSSPARAAGSRPSFSPAKATAAPAPPPSPATCSANSA